MAKRGLKIDGFRRLRTSDQAKRAWYYRRRMERYAAYLADPERIHAAAEAADRNSLCHTGGML